jgi:hypothetical protein
VIVSKVNECVPHSVPFVLMPFSHLNGINTKGTECVTHSFTFETITLEDTDPEDAKESSALAALHAAAETFYHQDAHRAASNTNRT